MPMQRCPMGHYYDPDRHSTCPACGVPSLDIAPTRGRAAADAPATPPTVPADPKTLARGQGHPAEGVTVGLVRKQLGIDPVVGWLVCVGGPDRGRDYRLRGEKNFIGRSPKMDVCIQGDDTISRDNHAAVSYNPKKNSFRLLPGEGRGLVYLNDEEVDAAVELQAYDRIELGQTQLLFVPFCGERFHWQAPA